MDESSPSSLLLVIILNVFFPRSLLIQVLTKTDSPTMCLIFHFTLSSPRDPDRRAREGSQTRWVAGRLAGLRDLGSRGTSSVRIAAAGYPLLHHPRQPIAVAATLAAAAFERTAAVDRASAGK